MGKIGDLTHLELEVVDFVRYVCFLHDIPDTSFMLHQIMIRVNKYGKVELPVNERNIICGFVEIALPTFNRYLKQICDAGLMLRIAHNQYKINRAIFGNGVWHSVEAVSMKVRYGSGKAFRFSREYRKDNG
jgi:hypothetical protein